MKQTGSRAMLVAALVAGALGGAASSQMWPAPRSAFADQQLLTSISAKQFEVMDDQGNMRGKLNVTGEQMAHLGLYDQQGIERAALVVTKEGATMLAMSGDDGKPRLTVNVANHEGPAAFALLNPDGSTAAELKMDKGARSILLADAGGKAQIRLQTNSAVNGGATLTFFDQSGKPLRKIP